MTTEAPERIVPPEEPAVHLPSSASGVLIYGWRLGWMAGHSAQAAVVYKAGLERAAERVEEFAKNVIGQDAQVSYVLEEVAAAIRAEKDKE